MAVQWGMTFWIANMVWIAVRGWVFSCFTVADEVAGSIRTGDIGTSEVADSGQFCPSFVDFWFTGGILFSFYLVIWFDLLQMNSSQLGQLLPPLDLL
ncbi:hypothetical protein ACOSP7_026619 [Xanthoceras sorbifolium]